MGWSWSVPPGDLLGWKKPAKYPGTALDIEKIGARGTCRESE
jgi:hypothetical protein